MQRRQFLNFIGGISMAMAGNAAAWGDTSETSSYKFITIEGKKLAYIDQGAGFPVLLGHSFLWDAKMWAPQIEALAPHFRLIVPDLWGHGRSDSLPPSCRNLDDLARQYLALLDAMEIREFHILGLSVGGMWGEALAQLAPDRVRKLVLMDTYLGPEPLASQARYLALLDQIERDGHISEPLLDIIVPIFFRPDIDLASPLPRKFRESLARLPADRLRQAIVPLGRMIFTRPDLRHRLKQLNPDNTLILVGEQDIPRPPQEAREMAGIIGCLCQTIPGAGHISNLENPEGVTNALLHFLT